MDKQETFLVTLERCNHLPCLSKKNKSYFLKKKKAVVSYFSSLKNKTKDGKKFDIKNTYWHNSDITFLGTRDKTRSINWFFFKTSLFVFEVHQSLCRAKKAFMLLCMVVIKKEIKYYPLRKLDLNSKFYVRKSLTYPNIVFVSMPYKDLSERKGKQKD